jgi:Tol biopolymer transport system component
MYPRYLPSGHLIYVTKGTLFAVPFDLDRLEVRGAPILLEEDVSSDPTLGFAQLDFSRSGTVAYRTGGTVGLRTIQWLDGTGKTESVLTEPAFYSYPHLSPDGSRLAYLVIQGSSTDLWTYDWQRGVKTRLTNGLEDAYPVWSPDGRFVVFQAAGGMFWTRADGAGQLRAGKPELFLKTADLLSFPAFSPDGRWLAYADAPAGSYEVYVRAFPDKGTQVQISNAGGTIPVWSRNGHELFYRTEDNRIMVANYTVKGESFLADKPRAWSGKQLANLGLAVNFDLAPDGKRFVVLMPVENPEPREAQNHLTLVVNFFDELRRRVPTGK